MLCYNGTMENRIVELYDASDLAALKKQRRVWIGVAVAVGVLTLALCILFCLLTRPQNEQTMLWSILITSAVGGWIVITLLHFRIDECKWALAHTEAMLSGEREPVEGSFAYTEEYTRIRKGISMRRVAVSGAPKVPTLEVYEAKVRRFAPEKAVRVYSVYGFITAYEVRDANV